MSLKRLLKEHNLLHALDATTLSFTLALSVTLELIQADHLLDTIFVLLLDAEFELELREHELDSGPKMGRFRFDEVCGIC